MILKKFQITGDDLPPNSDPEKRQFNCNRLLLSKCWWCNMASSCENQLSRPDTGPESTPCPGFPCFHGTVCRSLTKTPIYQVPPPPPQPVPIIKNPVIRKLQEETLPSLSITSSIEQDSVLGMDRRPEKEGNAPRNHFKSPKARLKSCDLVNVKF